MLCPFSLKGAGSLLTSGWSWGGERLGQEEERVHTQRLASPRKDASQKSGDLDPVLSHEIVSWNNPGPNT